MRVETYLRLRRRFAVSREMAATTIRWAEPLARRALGKHAQKDGMGLGEEIQIIPVLTTPQDNGGWGELMPTWFKPYERPLPIFVLDNWAMTALCLERWMGEVGPAFNIENLLKVFVASTMLIPFLPATQRGGHFLRHGALTVLLGSLWLDVPTRDALLSGMREGGRVFADAHDLRERSDTEEFMGRLEAEAFLIAEASKVGGEEKVRGFLSNEELFESYAALFGGLCFSVSALREWYGPEWEQWVFQAVNVHYRYARFGLEAWAKQLGVAYEERE